MSLAGRKVPASWSVFQMEPPEDQLLADDLVLHVRPLPPPTPGALGWPPREAPWTARSPVIPAIPQAAIT